jgi:glycerol-3-phosphate dehydrogenase
MKAPLLGAEPRRAALAKVFAEKGTMKSARRPGTRELCEPVNAASENMRYLTGVRATARRARTNDLASALDGEETVAFVVPRRSQRPDAGMPRTAAPYVQRSRPLGVEGSGQLFTGATR